MLTPYKLEQARLMRAEGKNWAHICDVIGETYYVVRATLDPEWHERRKNDVGDRRRRLLGLPVKRKPRAPCAPVNHVVSQVVVPPRVLFERERVLLAPRTISQALLGDPPPGRSALDKRRPHLVASND